MKRHTAVYVERVDGTRAMRVQPMTHGVHVLCYPCDTFSEGARAWLSWEQWDELVARIEASRLQEKEVKEAA